MISCNRGWANFRLQCSCTQMHTHIEMRNGKSEVQLALTSTLIYLRSESYLSSHTHMSVCIIVTWHKHHSHLIGLWMFSIWYSLMICQLDEDTPSGFVTQPSNTSMRGGLWDINQSAISLVFLPCLYKTIHASCLSWWGYGCVSKDGLKCYKVLFVHREQSHRLAGIVFPSVIKQGRKVVGKMLFCNTWLCIIALALVCFHHV